MRDLVLVDRDQAEAARREGIAEDRLHPRGEARRAAGLLCENEIARRGAVQVGDGKLAPLLLLDGPQPMPVALLMNDAEDEFASLEQLLHRMGDPPVPPFLGPSEDALADAERGRAFALPLHHPEPRRRPLRLPALRYREGAAGLVHVDDAKHRHLGDAAHPMEGPARAGVDQALVSHVAEQLLERDLLLPLHPERLGDLALACGRIRRLDEVEDLLAGGKAGSSGMLDQSILPNPLILSRH